MAVNSQANDAMIRRLERELEERTAAAQGLIANAEAQERDLNDAEKETLQGLENRIEEIKDQLVILERTSKQAVEAGERLRAVDQAIVHTRKVGAQTVEYRSAGEYALDLYNAHLGDREAQERLEVYNRVAAHQKTTDNPGVIPDPVVGEVINFIDSARPIVTALGVRPLPSSQFYRPRVTQNTAVDTQGSAGAASDEKTELVSQKMTISRITANAVTYGGYVNVSRQNIDFSNGQILDIIISDLAAQYAIQTEAAVADEIESTATSPVQYTAGETKSLAAALWEAVAEVYAATRGQGRPILVCATDVLAEVGPLFAPVNPQNAQSPGFVAANFGQGVMGSAAGISVVCSAGLSAGFAAVLSTAAVEVYEQRVGTLQVTEPSVLGLQVAYAGYFTPLTIEEDAIVPLEAVQGS